MRRVWYANTAAGIRVHAKDQSLQCSFAGANVRKWVSHAIPDDGNTHYAAILHEERHVMPEIRCTFLSLGDLMCKRRFLHVSWSITQRALLSWLAGYLSDYQIVYPITRYQCLEPHGNRDQLTRFMPLPATQVPAAPLH